MPTKHGALWACALLCCLSGDAAAQQIHLLPDAVMTASAVAAEQEAPTRAQSGVIAGRVTAADTGEPLALVEVSLRGTSFATVTNASGNYILPNVPPGLYSVRAGGLGYAETTRENVAVRAGTTTTVDFGLRTSALEIEPAQPGAGINILLRTPTSISRSNTPLFVVDGVILASTFGRSTADLAALDIESIEVVKGAAAASLYGSRAAAGVVQIRTRRGAGLETGQTRVTVRSEFGINQLARRISLASHHNYLTNAQGEYVNASGTVVERKNRVQRPASERFLDVPYKDPIYDHLDQFFDPGTFMVNSVTLAQNSDNTNFFTSFSNNRNSGVVLDHGGYDRNDVRVNLDHRIGANLQFSISGFHMRSERESLPGETFRGLVQQQPDVNLLDPDPDGTKYVWWPDETVSSRTRCTSSSRRVMTRTARARWRVRTSAGRRSAG
jgi:TonB-dependent SusC/RagA subfamily outer membrane receptor